ncbi:uncharacterized protein LOC134260251, partial [Saccostrea cucullata]|uniref:uncharacterized protein LOC134260251 n=1 Tax=Saccostrea cuccullata TaxID=36930 RepID=UPI002ED2CA94
MTEGLLICVRVGIFCLIPYFTVCPYHRSSLGLNWKRKTSCVFPGHTGKCKGDRPISLRTSYALVSRRGIFLHIGSAICKACRSQISNDLETFPDMVDVFSNDSCCFEHPLEDG